MKNQQAPERIAHGLGRILDVHSIFDTIQGEGPFAGTPATFIRLAGCNLQCPLCDTEYTEGRRTTSLDEIAGKVSGRNGLIVITGGEPFRQSIQGLVGLFKGQRRTVQIETNGMFDCGEIIPQLATIVLSPKTAKINKNTARLAHCYKYVVQAGDVADDGLPIHALGHPVPDGQTIARPPVGWRGMTYVQPADEKDDILNAANMATAVASVMQRPLERNLCIQMHKYANLA